MARALVMADGDNVATLLSDADRGAPVEVRSRGGEVLGTVIANGPIPFGHKIALRDLKEGERVVKYGEVIGRASRPIAKGDHVHVHNVESLRIRAEVV